MAKSYIEITFVSIPNVSDNLVIGDSLNATNLDEEFVELRLGHFLTTIGSDLNNCAFFYQDAVGLDYNATSLYVITFNLNVVTITATQSNMVFSEEINTSSGRITVDVFNETETEAITIDDISFSEADTDPCNNVKINVTTSRLAVFIDKGSGEEANADNPFDYDSVRNIDLSLIVKDADDNTDSETFSLPQFLSVDNTIINVLNSPDGATVTVLITNIQGLTLEYSLDDITYQTSNVFPGIATGDYTMYVKDDLGCSFTKDFSVADFEGGFVGVSIPNAELPAKENSIRYIRETTFGDCGEYKNDDNTLSCQEDVDLPEKTIQLFQACDNKVTTQLRSNYETITAKVIKEDETEDVIPVVKTVAYLNQNDKRDGILYDVGFGKTGIYFQTGKIYDYTTGLETGDYALNGNLPFWGKIGGWVSFDGTWFVIEQIIFDEDKKAEVLVIVNPFTDPDTVKVVSSVYNKENYDEYEFNIDMGVYVDQNISVEIVETDSNFDTVTFISEGINVKTRQTGTLEMKYKNLRNTKINYSTGIEHIMRLKLIKQGADKIDPSEVNRGDTRTILLDSKIYELKEFEFEPIATGMMIKALIALSCEVLTLDGVAYTKNDEIEVDGPLGDTNLYHIKSIQAKSGTLFDLLTQEVPQSEAAELPGIISGGDNIVGY